jgi:hypothetical protein
MPVNIHEGGAAAVPAEETVLNKPLVFFAGELTSRTVVSSTR